MPRIRSALLTFTAFAAARDECANVTSRADCGWNGVSQSQCESKGCCWMPAAAGSSQPWCFYKGGHGAPATLDLVSLASVDDDAVCNDGSPSGYYWKAGSAKSTTWIVDLEGGGWCTDEAECKARCPPGKMAGVHVCSSKSWSPSITLSGVMSPEADGIVAGANKAFVAYCTSDAHMGSADAFGMKFRGAVVIQAVLKEMVRRGLGQGAKRHTIIFGGQSAGGRGAMVHLDYVLDMLGPVASKNADVFGLLDSPLYLDIPPYTGSGFKGFRAECQGVSSFAKVDHLGAECKAAHSNETWKCLMGQYRVPQIQTPYILVAAEYDAYQLGRNQVSATPDAGHQKYAEMFASKTAALTKSIRSSWPASWKRQNAVYSRACYEHATSLTSAGYDKSQAMSNKTTMDTAMELFLHASGKLQWVDDCKGFACGGSDCKRWMYQDIEGEAFAIDKDKEILTEASAEPEAKRDATVIV